MTQNTVEIVQADRDDYAEFARMIGRITAKDADAIRNGEWDDTKDVRWFAERRVRLSHSSTPSEVERLREALQQIESKGSNPGIGVTRDIARAALNEQGKA